MESSLKVRSARARWKIVFLRGGSWSPTCRSPPGSASLVIGVPLHSLEAQQDVIGALPEGDPVLAVARRGDDHVFQAPLHVLVRDPALRDHVLADGQRP